MDAAPAQTVLTEALQRARAALLAYGTRPSSTNAERFQRSLDQLRVALLVDKRRDSR
jgi:hypothetical protein